MLPVFLDGVFFLTDVTCTQPSAYIGDTTILITCTLTTEQFNSITVTHNSTQLVEFKDEGSRVDTSVDGIVFEFTETAGSRTVIIQFATVKCEYDGPYILGLITNTSMEQFTTSLTVLGNILIIFRNDKIIIKIEDTQ